MTKCKTCGKSEGFYIKQKVKGFVFTHHKSNLKLGNNEEMHDGIDYYGTNKKATCESCYGFYGWVKDLVPEYLN